MNVLVFEDEQLSAQRLCNLLNEIAPEMNIVAVLDTVMKGVDWFESNPLPQLIFMDIHLADGIVFELFNQTKINTPVIFTTAFDEYAIRAFKVNSVDYLLKPIDKNDLLVAISKFKSLTNQPKVPEFAELFKEIQKLSQHSYKTRFLIKSGDQLKYVEVENLAYFRSENDVVMAVTHSKTKHFIDNSLEQLEKMLEPEHFFRINRKYIVSLKSIDTIHNYFNGRLKLHLKPQEEDEVLVSRERVGEFKKWLDV